MNSVEKLIEEGRQQGHRQTLTKLLRLKFGDVSADDIERIEHADEAELDEYISRVLTADSVAAVLGRA